jgi:hypothetical protein
MVQWSLGVGRVMAVTGRVEALFGAIVASTVGLPRAMQISALKIDQRMMVVTASVPYA